jgi:tetratricopeptide (TPR) repeat protein
VSRRTFIHVNNKHKILLFACAIMAGLCGCKTRQREPQAITPATMDSARVSEDYYQRAASLYEEGLHNDSALALTDSALIYRRDQPNIWHLRGNLLGRHDDFIGARAAYDEAIRLKPDYAWAWWHRGCLHASTGLPDSALVDLQRAISIDASFKSGPFEDDCWKIMRADARLVELTR